jgi:hypothetical protein
VRVSLMQFVTDLTPPPQAVAAWAEETAQVCVYSSVCDPRARDIYREAGVAEVALTLPSAGRDEVLAALDRLAPLVSEFGAEVTSVA